MKRETHLIEVMRTDAHGLFTPGRTYQCPPPERGRYEITPFLRIPVEDVKLIAVEHKETSDL